LPGFIFDFFMTKWFKRFQMWPKPVLVAVCIGLVGVVGFVDYITGYEAIFFTFYLIPVVLAVWCIDAFWGVLISALGVFVWRVSNLEAGAHYSSSFITLWNVAVIFVLYLIVVGLLKFYKELDERVRQRTAALTHEMLERRRLEKELLETAEREQRRIGQDLHDSLCQHLTATALAGQLLGQKLAGKSIPDAAAADHIVELVEEAIDLTRTLARSLHPVEMQGEGILDGFRELASNAADRFKIICQFKCRPELAPPDFDAATNIHLYRIAQEAITNAIKHGKAANITIGLEVENGAAILTVTDDGAGISQNRRDGQGMGLRIMAYRAGMIGGSFDIGRLPGRGTRVTCKFPATPEIYPETHAQKK
jgi:signal transduction histidine kinase